MSLDVMFAGLLIIYFLHWIGDFVLQTDNMALNKSHDNNFLFLHCSVYSLMFVWLGITFYLLNFVLHFAVDYFTSRMTARLWEEERRHEFFVIIGMDQFIHIFILTLLYYCIWAKPLGVH